MTHEAFEAAYKLHRSYMLILGRRLVGAGNAEDILQDAVCKLLAGHLANMPDNSEDAKPYFIKALFSAGLDFLRKLGRERQVIVSRTSLPEELDLEEIFADNRPGPGRLAESAAFLRAFRGVKLSDHQWRVVEGYYGRGVTLRQVAQEMGITRLQAKDALHEANVKLRRALQAWAPHNGNRRTV